MFAVVGDWKNAGPYPTSKIGQQIIDNLGCLGANGGNVSNLRSTISNMGKFHNELLWMPNIPNSEDKILPIIKQQHPHLFLICSKNSIGRDYTKADFIGMMLKNRCNLGIYIEKCKSTNDYFFSLMDPLGNQYCSTSNIEDLCSYIKDRVSFLKSLTRLPSLTVGLPSENINIINDNFIEIVKNYGEKFSKFVNAINPNRYLGNAATRCQNGFAGVKATERLFVTKRNIDKTQINKDHFVEVVNDINKVLYYGNHKPSVDTPIQIRLFNYYPHINYIIHGHCYIDNERFTQHRIPCGYIDEFMTIIDQWPNRSQNRYLINLKGHGCLIMGHSLRDLTRDVKLISRPFPEISGSY